MVVGNTSKVHPKYLSVSIPSSPYEHRQSKSASPSKNLPRIGRTTTRQQHEANRKRSMLQVNRRPPTSEHNQIRQSKQCSRQITETRIVRYYSAKTTHSLISVDQMISKQIKSNLINTTVVVDRSLHIKSNFEEENQEYVDDWESDFSDETSSVEEDEWEPIKEEPREDTIRSITAQPKTDESMNNEQATKSKTGFRQTDFENNEKQLPEKNVTKSINRSTQSRSGNERNFDREEEIQKSTNTPMQEIFATDLSTQEQVQRDFTTYVRNASPSTKMQGKYQLPTNPSSNNISLIPLDASAFEPEFCKKRQAAIDNVTYRTAVSSWKARTLPDVVKLILELSYGRNLIDRAWIVFYWVSQNIEYDMDAYFSGNIRHQTTNDIFNNRRGVCDAFGTIFEAICNGVGLECKKVSGYAKGYGFELENPIFNSIDHAWNALHLDGHWYLVDPTWGEGHIDYNKKTVKELDPFYFLTRPEQMIFDHLPENSQWQLLKYPLSMTNFIGLPKVYSSYFELGLELVYPYQSNRVLFNSNEGLVEVLLRASQNISCTANIKYFGTSKNKADTLVQYDTGRQVWQCLFAPQIGGFHTLIIYGKRQEQLKNINKNDNKSYKGVVELGLQVPHDFNGTKTFPITYSTFSDNKCQILEPLNGNLKTGSKQRIQCRIPGALSARLLLDGNWLPEVNLRNEIFTTEFIVPRREIQVLTKFKNKMSTSSYDVIMTYSVH